MIATYLQDDLAKELEGLFSDSHYYDVDGNPTSLHVYKQFLPVQGVKDLPEGLTDEQLEEGTYYAAESQEDPFPYIIVRVGQGTIEDPNGAETVYVTLLLGVHDKSYNNQGYKDIMHMIQVVHHRFSKNPVLAHSYECVMPMQWALQDEESYPYFFGGMALKFQLVPIRREDRYT